MGIIIYKTLVIVKQNNIKNYREYLELFIKPKENNNSYLNIKNIINTVINLFILITFFIMIAGFGAYFKQELGINNLLGSCILSILCLFVFKTNQKGVVKVSSLLVPILIAFITIICFLNIKDINFIKLDNYLVDNNNFKFIIDSILLVCSITS